MSYARTNNIYRSGLRIALCAALLVVFLSLIWFAGRDGLASLLTAYAARANIMASADAAVDLRQNDPDAHAVRGSLLEANSDLPGAISEYQTATALRPDDYVLWLNLARARELSGDDAGAIAAAKRAIPLAPFYAQPHWQLGNLLVRAGRREEGFSELRLAGSSNPTLLPAIIDLAWQLSGGDVDFVKQVIHPEVPASFQALADFFKRHGAVAEAIEMLAASGSSGEQSRRQYLGQLITDRRFTDAYALWSTMHPGNVPGTLVDPGFEREQDLTDPGFGWRSANKSASLALSLDTEEPRDGHSSLRIDFNGESDPGMSIISQLVLIEPNTRYYLRFSYRADRIISGGRPNAIVLDARDKTVLGQSGALAATTDGWRDIAIGFHSTQSMEAVEVALRRDRCDKSPCPIFGRLWLDSFSLQKQ